MTTATLGLALVLTLAGMPAAGAEPTPAASPAYSVYRQHVRVWAAGVHRGAQLISRGGSIPVGLRIQGMASYRYFDWAEHQTWPACYRAEAKDTTYHIASYGWRALAAARAWTSGRRAASVAHMRAAVPHVRDAMRNFRTRAGTSC